MTETAEDLRYPIGQFDKETIGDAATRAQHLEVLRLFPENLSAAVHGLTDPQLDTPYREDGWTVRQLVHHVADSHMNAYVRFKLALTEDWPTIKTYEEAEWARLADSLLDIPVSLDLLTNIHTRWLAFLDALTEEDFARGYVHPAMGRQSLQEVVARYSWHSRHHLAHITNLRTRMGW